MNSCQLAPLLVITGILFLLIFITKPWEAPKDNQQRWIRSFVTGILTAIMIISGFVLIGLSRSMGNCLNDIQNLKISGYWACIGIPVLVITTIGTYIGYGQIIWLHSIRKKIDRRNK